MVHTEEVVQRNAEQIKSESSQAVLVQLLHQDAQSFVITTRQLARLLGKSEAALRLAETRHRAKFGAEFLPKPLLQNAEGRVWSIVQIAQWLAQEDQAEATTPLPGLETVPKKLGRPRKAAAVGFGELA